MLAYHTEQKTILRKAILLSVFFFVTTVFFFGCKKVGELTPVNSNSDLNARYTEKMEVQSITVRDSSLRTDEVSRAIFGILNDAELGVTMGSGNTQFNLSTAQLSFPEGAVMDSVVLKIGYDNLYGKEGTKIKVNVYELSESILESESYFNNSKVGVAPNVIGSASFVPNLQDSTSSDTLIKGPHVSIPIDLEIGQRILNNGTFESNSDLVELFKGVRFEPDTTSLPSSGEGVLVSFNLLSEDSRMILYYTYPDDGGGSIGGKYSLSVTTGTPRYSNYTHDYSNSTVINKIGDVSALVNYVQPLAGVKTKITFPNLKDSLEGGKTVINKAELIIKVADNSDDALPVPGRLVLLTTDEEGNNLFIPDFFEGTDYYGGNYDINTRTYRFNIARYLDEIINKKMVDRGLYLLVSGSAVNANRLILNSGSAPQNKLLLKLTYTQL